jgi:hypothetical protein
MRGFTSSLVAALLLAGAANSLAQECIGTGASVSLGETLAPQDQFMHKCQCAGLLPRRAGWLRWLGQQGAG